MPHPAPTVPEGAGPVIPPPAPGREPRESGITVSDHLEAAEAAEAFAFNGRETAAYVLGFWQRHLRDAQNAGYYDQPEAERLALEILPTVRDEHLAATAALLIRAGATVDVHSSSNGVLTLRVSSR